MLLLTGDDAEQSVLRMMTKEPWRRHAPGLLARESAVQSQLAGSPIPAPRSLALDLSGDHAGAPAHLMSRLPGKLRLHEAADDVVTALARVLTDIHRFEPEGGKPREYQSWASPGKRVVPTWAQQPELWNEAFALLAQPVPVYDGKFLHRDFHPGNVLWSNGG
ncbi:Phosphotransferase enzyme family protein [Actinoplanes philippinensis]|uniref:Phosphotransferase enzyme family protein n=2 Tax=Actinoplanes philippinensis TaxID=35752 RepID=A0A1I2KRY0_9ACTN|nr:Phosphotransferase enzyme family protein [Actinoplanes philippinensis]